MLAFTKKLAFAMAVPTVTLSGCYVVPIAPDGTAAIYPYPYLPPQYAPAANAGPVPPRATSGGPMPAVLQARLYPTNDIAAQTGMITGTVTNMMTGKGQFQMEYKGELLAGEATRVSGDERRGVANAYGPRGTYMSCDYKMTSPYQGAGKCTMSTGAQYEVHLGS
jgi:hypothetical protein